MILRTSRSASNSSRNGISRQHLSEHYPPWARPSCPHGGCDPATRCPCLAHNISSRVPIPWPGNDSTSHGHLVPHPPSSSTRDLPCTAVGGRVPPPARLRWCKQCSSNVVASPPDFQGRSTEHGSVRRPPTRNLAKTRGHSQAARWEGSRHIVVNFTGKALTTPLLVKDTQKPRLLETCPTYFYSLSRVHRTDQIRSHRKRTSSVSHWFPKELMLTYDCSTDLRHFALMREDIRNISCSRCVLRVSGGHDFRISNSRVIKLQCIWGGFLAEFRRKHTGNVCRCV